MFTSCAYTHDSGETCKSPAIRGTSLCYNHTPHEPIKRQQPEDDSQPFDLPPITSKSGIISALSEVLHRLARRQIRRSEAETFIRGFNLLLRLMSELDEETAGYAPHRTAEPEEEPTNEDLQKIIDEIGQDLGVEMPSIEEMLHPSTPNQTPEQAVEHWIATGKIRPRHPATNSQVHS